jgi:hypothetical protein
MKFEDLEINNVFEEAEACMAEDPDNHIIDVLDEQPKMCSWSMGKRVSIWNNGKRKLAVVNRDVMVKAMTAYQHKNKILLNDSSLTPKVAQGILLTAWNITQGIEV